MLALFFLFRDGEWLGRRLLDHADRVLGVPGERLAERLVLAARGTFNGTVLVAVAEGVLIGIGYIITGVPHAVLFGAMTAAFAMLPFAWFAFKPPPFCSCRKEPPFSSRLSCLAGARW